MTTPRRRPYRARAILTFADREFVATTRDISASGLGVIVSMEELQGVLLTPAARLKVRFALDGSETPLTLACEVAWITEKSLDLSGKPAIGLGLRFVEAHAQVESFVNHFRHTLVVLSNNIQNVHFTRETAADEYHVHAYMRADEAFASLTEHAVSVLIVDTSQHDSSVLKMLRSTAMNLPHAHFAILLITDAVSTPQFESLLDLGRVLHYLRKPLDGADFRHTLKLAVEAYVMRSENERLNAELERMNTRLLAENAHLRLQMKSEPMLNRVTKL